MIRVPSPGSSEAASQVDSRRIAESLPWQANQWQHLYRLRSEQKLPHALLLRGPQGTGKRHFANALAQALLCQQSREGRACGHCKTCWLALAGTHPDWLTVGLEEGARQIKIDQIRDVVEFATKKAQLSGFRVIIIDPAEAMNINAANALLKSLEEPGSNTVLILVSHQSSGLLPTIRSRCQALDFPVPAFADALVWLTEQCSTEQQARRLLAITGGAPVAAAALRDAAWPEERDAICQEWLAVLEQRVDLSVVAARWAKLPVPDVLRSLLAWFIDVHRLRVGANELVVNQDLLPLLQKVNQHVQLDTGLQDYYLYLQQAYQKVLSTANPNAQLLLESLLIRWQRLARRVT